MRIEGHSDSIPVHTERYKNNWELSSARAISTLEVLTERYHISPERLGVTGYAHTSPLDTNDTAEGRAHNRRVDLVIVSQLGLESIPGKGGDKAKSQKKSKH